jgi:hypothetical protein
MNDNALFYVLLAADLALAAITAGVLLFIPAPYGRHQRAGWGPGVEQRLGWVIMEAPAALVFAACFMMGEYRASVVSWVFFGMWEVHYIHRSLLYPFSLCNNRKRMPMVIVGSGVVFNALNAYLNGYYLFTLSGGYPDSWLLDPRFIAGLALFVAGYVVNRQADHILRLIRRCDRTVYSIPHGGLYRWVSSPNYLGEIIEWTGWAIATWSLPGLAFALWTIANLAPRARSHHAWYRRRFPDYPPERKALLPGIW